MALVDYASDNAAGTIVFKLRLGQVRQFGSSSHSRSSQVQVPLLRKTVLQTPTIATSSNQIAIGKSITMRGSVRLLQAGFWLVAFHLVLPAVYNIRRLAINPSLIKVYNRMRARPHLSANRVAHSLQVSINVYLCAVKRQVGHRKKLQQPDCKTMDSTTVVRATKRSTSCSGHILGN